MILTNPRLLKSHDCASLICTLDHWFEEKKLILKLHEACFESLIPYVNDIVLARFKSCVTSLHKATWLEVIHVWTNSTVHTKV